jgi:hypothetical protein
MRLHGPHLFKKLQRIEGAGDFAQFKLRGLRHTFGLQKSLTRSARTMPASTGLACMGWICPGWIAALAVIPYADFDSPRYVTRALYGIGNQVLCIALTDNPKIVDSTYEQVVSIPKLSTGAPVGGVLRTTRSPHGFCCMRLPLSCFEQSFSQRLTHVRAVQFVTA